MSFDFVPNQDTDAQLARLLNRGLTFQDNVRCAILEVELEFGMTTIQHGLGFTPLGYIVIWQSDSGAIYGGPTNLWTNQAIVISSDVAQDARIIVL